MLDGKCERADADNSVGRDDRLNIANLQGNKERGKYKKLKLQIVHSKSPGYEHQQEF